MTLLQSPRLRLSCLAGLCGLMWYAAAGASAAPPAGQAVSFQAADGFRLSADYYPPSSTAGDAPFVILLHMYRSDRTAWAPLIEPLHAAGLAILALDLRGHGESATTESRDRVIARESAIFREMQADLRGAYDWIVTQPHIDRARFALVGASVGASVALQCAAKDRSVDAVVCLSPGLDYLGLDSAGDIAQIMGRSALMLATEDERDAPYTLRSRGRDVEVKIYRNLRAHGTDMLGKIPHVERDVVDFLRKALGQPAEQPVYGSINSDVYHLKGSEWIAQISPTNLRVYSSAAEAEARGLRRARSQGPGDNPGSGDTPPQPRRRP